MWTSADGSTWARVPHDEALFGGENDQEMFGVIAAGPGLVAVGVDDDAPAVWLSADGTNWRRIGDAGAFGGVGEQEMYGVVVAASRLIAVGRDGVNAAVWVSPPPG